MRRHAILLAAFGLATMGVPALAPTATAPCVVDYQPGGACCDYRPELDPNVDPPQEGYIPGICWWECAPEEGHPPAHCEGWSCYNPYVPKWTCDPED